jgi:hypothetical protein
MTPLHERMLHELQRCNYAPSTIRSYLGEVQQSHSLHSGMVTFPQHTSSLLE